MEGGALLRGSCVGRLALSIEASDVAYSYRVLVVVLAVGADGGFRAPSLNGAVTTDDIVIADSSETADFVPAGDVGSGVVLAIDGGGAVDDDECDGTHGGHVGGVK